MALPKNDTPQDVCPACRLCNIPVGVPPEQIFCCEGCGAFLKAREEDGEPLVLSQEVINAIFEQHPILADQMLQVSLRIRQKALLN